MSPRTLATLLLSTLAFPVIAGAALRGRILDAQGRPIVGVMVQVVTSHKAWQTHSAPDGGFFLLVQDHGPSQIRFLKDGLPNWSMNADLPPDGGYDLQAWIGPLAVESWARIHLHSHDGEYREVLLAMNGSDTTWPSPTTFKRTFTAADWEHLPRP